MKSVNIATGLLLVAAATASVIPQAAYAPTPLATPALIEQLAVPLLASAEPTIDPTMPDPYPYASAEPSVDPTMPDPYPYASAEPSADSAMPDPYAYVTAEPSADPTMPDPLASPEPSFVPEITDPFAKPSPVVYADVDDPVASPEPSGVPLVEDPFTQPEDSDTYKPRPTSEALSYTHDHSDKAEPTLAASMIPVATVTPAPSADACERAFQACNLRFAGSETELPTFLIDQAADVPFTQPLVWRDSSVRVGVANSNLEGELVTTAGSFVPFSAYDTGAAQRLSRSQFKTFAIAGTPYSGVGHEVFQGNAEVAKGKCVRVRVSGYQTLDASMSWRVSGNVNGVDECVVFRTAL